MSEDYAEPRRKEAELSPDGAGLSPREEVAAPISPIAPPAPAQRAASPVEPRPPEPAARFSRKAWWDAATPNMRGTVLMIAAFTVFTVMTALIKLVGARIPIAQILVTRQVVMTVVLLALIGRELPNAMRTKRPMLQFQRGFFSLGAMLCGFTALIHMPLADATAIGFSQVLFVTLLAILVLREIVDWRRWLAMAVGFCGVLVILRPSGEALNVFALLALAGALFGAGITITVRRLGDSERTETILLWQGAIILAVLTVPAFLFWVQPTVKEWVLLVALGLVGTAGQWLITRAYQIGEASALAPLDFVRLLLAVVTGYLVFAEIPGLATMLGAALIVGATLYTMRRNYTPRPPAPHPVD